MATVTVTAAPVVTVAVAPKRASVVAGAAQQFTATVTGSSDTAVIWSVQESSGCGSVSQTGLYTAPSAVATCHIIATSHADGKKNDVATVTVTATPVVVVAVSPKTTTVVAGASAQFTAIVTGSSDTAVVWSIQESSGCGSVSQAGLYTAPPAAATCHVVATSHADGTKNDVATVTVTAAPVVAVAVSPKTASVVSGKTQQFAATVTGSSDTAVIWSVRESSGCGSVSQAGLYTAPSAAATCHVIATSHADGTKSDVATVTVTATPVVAVAVSPKTTSVVASTTAQFSAIVTGSSDTAVVWSIQESSGCGSVSQAGLYTAPAAAATCHVVATSHADGTKSDVATVTVTAAPVVAVAVSPTTASVGAGASQQFTATVTGSSNTSVSWKVQESSGCGSVSQTGLYTAPAAAATCHVVATSAADGTKSATATITVTASTVTVAVSPATASVVACQTLTLTATVTGSSNTAVTWSVQEGSCRRYHHLGW